MVYSLLPLSKGLRVGETQEGKPLIQTLPVGSIEEQTPSMMKGYS
ncbi:hypothetical protein GCM10028825_13110 [Spirosoma agri]